MIINGVAKPKEIYHVLNTGIPEKPNDEHINIGYCGKESNLFIPIRHTFPYIFAYDEKIKRYRLIEYQACEECMRITRVKCKRGDM